MGIRALDSGYRGFHLLAHRGLFFFVSSGIKPSSWLIKLEPDEFKVITSLPIKPRYCCRLSLGRQLVSWANSAAHQKHKLENLHGVMDMDMMTGCSDLCPFCGRGVHVEIGPSRIFPTVLLTVLPPHYSQLQELHPWGGIPMLVGATTIPLPCCFWALWMSSYKSLDASRDEWAAAGVPLQDSLHFCFGPHPPFIHLLSWGNYPVFTYFHPLWYITSFPPI